MLNSIIVVISISILFIFGPLMIAIFFGAFRPGEIRIILESAGLMILSVIADIILYSTKYEAQSEDFTLDDVGKLSLGLLFRGVTLAVCMPVIIWFWGDIFVMGVYGIFAILMHWTIGQCVKDMFLEKKEEAAKKYLRKILKEDLKIDPEPTLRELDHLLNQLLGQLSIEKKRIEVIEWGITLAEEGLDPKDVYRGINLSAQGRYSEAEECQRRALDLAEGIPAVKGSPHVVPLMLDYKTTLIEQKKYAEAEQVCRQVIEIDEYNLHALLDLAALLEVQGKFGEAIGMWLEASNLFRLHGMDKEAEKVIEKIGTDTNFSAAPQEAESKDSTVFPTNQEPAPKPIGKVSPEGEGSAQSDTNGTRLGALLPLGLLGQQGNFLEQLLNLPPPLWLAATALLAAVFILGSGPIFLLAGIMAGGGSSPFVQLGWTKYVIYRYDDKSAKNRQEFIDRYSRIVSNSEELERFADCIPAILRIKTRLSTANSRRDFQRACIETAAWINKNGLNAVAYSVEKRDYVIVLIGGVDFLLDVNVDKFEPEGQLALIPLSEIVDKCAAEEFNLSVKSVGNKRHPGQILACYYWKGKGVELRQDSSGAVLILDIEEQGVRQISGETTFRMRCVLAAHPDRLISNFVLAPAQRLPVSLSSQPPSTAAPPTVKPESQTIFDRQKRNALWQAMNSAGGEYLIISIADTEDKFSITHIKNKSQIDVLNREEKRLIAAAFKDTRSKISQYSSGTINVPPQLCLVLALPTAITIGEAAHKLEITADKKQIIVDGKVIRGTRIRRLYNDAHRITLEGEENVTIMTLRAFMDVVMRYTVLAHETNILRDAARKIIDRRTGAHRKPNKLEQHLLGLRREEGMLENLFQASGDMEVYAAEIQRLLDEKTSTTGVLRQFQDDGEDDYSASNNSEEKEIGQSGMHPELSSYRSSTVFQPNRTVPDSIGKAGQAEAFSSHKNPLPLRKFNFAKRLFYIDKTKPWRKPNLIMLWRQAAADALAIDLGSDIADQLLVYPRGGVLYEKWEEGDLDLTFYFNDWVYEFYGERGLPYARIVNRFIELAESAGLTLIEEGYDPNTRAQPSAHNDRFNQFPVHLQNNLGNAILLDIHDGPLCLISPEIADKTGGIGFSYDLEGNYFGSRDMLAILNRYVRQMNPEELTWIKLRDYNQTVHNLELYLENISSAYQQMSRVAFTDYLFRYYRKPFVRVITLWKLVGRYDKVQQTIARLDAIDAQARSGKFSDGYQLLEALMPDYEEFLKDFGGGEHGQHFMQVGSEIRQRISRRLVYHPIIHASSTVCHLNREPAPKPIGNLPLEREGGADSDTNGTNFCALLPLGLVGVAQLGLGAGLQDALSVIVSILLGAGLVAMVWGIKLGAYRYFFKGNLFEGTFVAQALQGIQYLNTGKSPFRVVVSGYAFGDMLGRYFGLFKSDIQRIYLRIIGYFHHPSSLKIINIDCDYHNFRGFFHEYWSYLLSFIMLVVPAFIKTKVFATFKFAQFRFLPFSSLNRLDDFFFRSASGLALQPGVGTQPDGFGSVFYHQPIYITPDKKSQYQNTDDDFSYKCMYYYRVPTQSGNCPRLNRESVPEAR